MNLVKISILVLALSSANMIAASFYGVSDPIMAEYEGFWTATNGAKGRLTAQIRPLANNRYDGFILLFRTRSPVAGFNLQPAVLDQEKIAFKAVTSTKEEGGDLLAKNEATCRIENGKLTGMFKGDLGDGTFEAEKSQRKSPTLGAKPPAGAIVLFDGKPSDAWESVSWPVRDGILQVGAGNIRVKNKLDDFRLHLEFRTPYMPIELGQARGNSGVYLQGKYEVQVLDSFGLYPLKDNDCAGIYRTQAPQLNACLAPMEWQTYDITYRSDGPRVTVVHNGITVIESARIPPQLVQSGTGGGESNSGFLMLQDHGNPVQFRNIWAEPLQK
jgi:hypothetical protein